MIFFIGDVHLQDKKEDIDWSFNHQGFLNFLESLNLTKEDTIIQLGDLFEKPKHKGLTNRAALKAIKYISEKSAGAFLLQGNHDQTIYSGSNLDSINVFENIRVVKEIERHVFLQSKMIFLFLPYIEGLFPGGKYEETVNKFCKEGNLKKVDIIVGHHCYKQNTYPDTPYLDINLLNFKFDKVIQGHVHKFETFKNVTRSEDVCIGSISPWRKDEMGQMKCYATLDDRGLTYIAIEPKFFSQFISVDWASSIVSGSEKDFTVVSCVCKKEEKYIIEQEIRRKFLNNLYDIEWDLIEEKKIERIEVKSDVELVQKFFEENKYSKDVKDKFKEYDNE